MKLDIEQLRAVSMEMETGYGAFGETERFPNLNLNKFAILVQKEMLKDVLTICDAVGSDDSDISAGGKVCAEMLREQYLTLRR